MHRRDRQAWNRDSNKLVISSSISSLKKYWYFFIPITIVLYLLYTISLPVIDYDIQKALAGFLFILEIVFLIQISSYPRKISIWENYLLNLNDIELPLHQLQEVNSHDERIFLLTQFSFQHLKAKNQIELDNRQKLMVMRHLLPKEDIISFTKIEKDNAKPIIKWLNFLLALFGLPTMILMVLFGIIKIARAYSNFLFIAEAMIIVFPPFIIILIIQLVISLKTYNENSIWINFFMEKQFDDAYRTFQGYLLYANDKAIDEITQFQVLTYAQNYIKRTYNSTNFDIIE